MQENIVVVFYSDMAKHKHIMFTANVEAILMQRGKHLSILLETMMGTIKSSNIFISSG